jgi:hypothetical protein
MENRLVYLTNPANIVSFVIFVFSLWAAWSNLNGRLKALEKKTEEIDVSKIETKLAEISTDLQWVKMELQKLSK